MNLNQISRIPQNPKYPRYPKYPRNPHDIPSRTRGYRGREWDARWWDPGYEHDGEYGPEGEPEGLGRGDKAGLGKDGDKLTV